MLQLNIDKMQELVRKYFMNPEKIKWKTDKDGKLYSISMHSEWSTFDIFWLDLGDAHYSVLYDSRKQRIYIRDETFKPEIKELLLNGFKNTLEILFSAYRACLKISDDWERIDD